MNPKISDAFSVSQLSNILKACFENPNFQHLKVYGEVYSLRLGKFSYIDLGDQGHKETNSPLLKCAFSTYYGNDLGLEDIKVGDVILVEGALSYYPHGSSVTFWGNKVTVLQSQAGKSLLAKKKTLEMLDKLGYLDEKRKRPIPKFCSSVAILTASKGAAYQDILKTLHDRFPTNTTLYPIVVQGDKAISSIVKALEKAQKGNHDVILLGRGGGSKTDLSCFDDEKVALAIARSKIPVITCIGHTIDTAIADRVSDAHAITPTEGASLINPSLEEIQGEREEYLSDLEKEFRKIIQEYALALDSFKENLEAYSPKRRLESERKQLLSYQNALHVAYSSKIHLEREKRISYTSSLSSSFHQQLMRNKENLKRFKDLLDAFDPSRIQEKGYALIYEDGKLVKSVSELSEGKEIIITYPDGRKKAKVLNEEN